MEWVPWPDPGVTSAQVTSVLAVHEQVEPIVSVNGNCPPRDETKVGRLVPGAQDGLGDGEGLGDGLGEGDGEGAVGPGDSSGESPQPSASTSAKGASRRRNVITPGGACMGTASLAGRRRPSAWTARKFHSAMRFGPLAARQRNVEIV
jgi:hypothetical protein